MAQNPSVSLSSGCEEILHMPVASGNDKGKPDRMIDPQIDFDLCSLAHDLAHIFQIIK